MSKKITKRAMAGFLALLLVVLMMPVMAFATVNEGDVCKIGDTGYATLANAINNVKEGEIITILKDVVGASGISIPSGKTFTVDFNKHKYSTEKPGAGSAGTTTQAFQILKDSNITFKNGTISCTEANKDYTWDSSSSNVDKGVAMIIQNYANLTLENMVIDGTNIAHNGSNTRYMISNNSGTVKFDSVKIIAPDGDFAFDSCKYASYSCPTVTVKGKSVINGKVEATGGNINFEDGSIVNGQIRVGENKSGGATGSVVTLDTGATVNNKGNYAFVVFGQNTLRIRGTVNGIVGTNGNAYNAGSVISVENGSKITEESDVAIYMPNGELNISGGTIIGKTAVYFKSTKLTITGGLLIGNGEKANYKYNGNGCDPTGDALVIDSCNYPSGLNSGDVLITGGMFKSEKNNAVAAFTYGEATPVTKFISDGFFSSEPDANYIKEGYSLIKNNGKKVDKEEYPWTVGYVVTFVSNGGTLGQQKIGVRNKETVSKDDVKTPKKDKNSFVGWVDSSGKQFLFDTPITGNITIYANWLSDDAKGKITVKDTEEGIKAETSIKKSDIPLTADDVLAIERGETLNVNLVVEVKEATKVEEDAKLIEQVMGDNQILGMYLDCTMFKTINGEEAGKIEETLNPITITLTIPEDLRAEGRVYSIIRVHNNEVETLLDKGEADKDWKISFKTDKFSTYAMVYEGGTAINPKTGDNNITILFACFGVLALLGISVVISVIFRRRFDK